MEVVGVGGIVIGCQDHIEMAACRARKVSKKLFLVAAAIPVSEEIDGSAICRSKPCDVEGTGRGVETHRPAVAHGPASVGAEMVDDGNRAAERVEGDLLHDRLEGEPRGEHGTGGTQRRFEHHAARRLELERCWHLALLASRCIPADRCNAR